MCGNLTSRVVEPLDPLLLITGWTTLVCGHALAPAINPASENQLRPIRSSILIKLISGYCQVEVSELVMVKVEKLIVGQCHDCESRKRNGGTGAAGS